MEKYLKNFKNCRQKEIPFCIAECPFHIDIPDFIEKTKRGDFKAAFKTYRNAAGFPLIASSLCHEPCKGVCPRKETDSAIDLLMLEKACIAFAENKSPTDYNLPGKKKKVAVIGAGISGLACALRLCMKKYEVEIFEATGRIGGYLWELLSPEVFLADIKEQFQHENYVLHLNTPVKSVDELADRGFDAVYVATGEGGEDFGLLAKKVEEDNGPAGQSPVSGGHRNSDSGGHRNSDSGGHRNSDSGENRYCALYGNAGWFAGGGLIGEEPVYTLANGLYMGTVIDNFLKTGNLLNPRNLQQTCMRLDPEKLAERKEPVRPENGASFSKEEAKREASRCLECQCDFCRTYCDLTDFYNKWPLRIRDEILATTLPGGAEVKMTPAKRLLSTCSQCGLCLETCPEDIDIGGLILAGRKSMHRQKKAPWVFHDFWLRDMDFANSEAAAISRAHGKSGAGGGPEGTPADIPPAEGVSSARNTCEYAFFPGCQLGASDPELVKKAYGYLLEKRPDTGLLLRCCGAPAEWSGDEEKFNGEVETIHRLWTELGKPTLVLACPTCEKKFKTYMADIPVVSLYEIIARWGLEPAPSINQDKNAASEVNSVNRTGSLIENQNGKAYSVFDACAARQEKGMKKAVRELAESAGYRLEPLKRHDAYGQCCGYGGQPGAANPKYVEFVAQKRISESDNPYITYCVNCRDIFTEAGKEAVHILDLLLGDGRPPQKLATISERRVNRIRLKQDLLKRYWDEEPVEEKKANQTITVISAALSEKLNRDRILEEDVIEVLGFCERTGRRVFHPDTGTYSGYGEIGHTTYWVEYRAPENNRQKNKAPESGTGGREQGTTHIGREQDTVHPENKRYELVNAYAHRMKIELEAVWNGRKVEPDL